MVAKKRKKLGGVPMGMRTVRHPAVNGAAPALAFDPLAEVEKVASQFTGLRGRLVRELKASEDRAEQLRRAIARIDTIAPEATPSDDAPDSEPVEATLADKSVSDVILAAVAGHPGGATIADIKLFAERSGKQFNLEHTPNYVLRLTKRGALRKDGARGSMRYYLA